MTVSVPQLPIVNAGLLYIQGMQLSNDATTPHTLLDIAAGQCRDITNSNDIVLPNAVVLNIAAKGANGLDTGTVAASKLYYVYAIASSGSLVPAACLMSLSLNPVLPFDYDMYRRIGCIATDGSTFIRKFVQVGSSESRFMWYDAGIAPGSAATSGSTSYVTIGTLITLVPQINCQVLVNCSLTPNSAGNVLDLQPSGGTGLYAQMSGVVASQPQIMPLWCPVGFNGGSPSVVEIDYKTSSGSDTVAFLVQGYLDVL